MPRVGAQKSKAVAAGFSSWFETALRRSGLTIGQLVYMTRPHVADEGSELSYSTLKSIVTGASAPTVPTVLRLVGLLSKSFKGPGSSTLSALYSSYPNFVARIVIGLDLIGLDTYRVMFMTTPQAKRQTARMRTQERLGSLAASAINACKDYTKRKDRDYFLVPDPGVANWIRRLNAHIDLLSVCLAYSYFGPFYGDTISMEFRAVFECYDEKRERMFAEALHRYETTFACEVEHSESYAHDILANAERLLASDSLSTKELSSAVSPLFSVWANVFSPTFVEAVPLPAWVDVDTVRVSLQAAST